MRLGGVAAHDDHGLGVADVVVAVGHRAVAPGVGYAGDRGGVTDARLMVRVVGAPERREFAVEIGGLVGELGRAEPVDRVRPRLLADRVELVADLADRLIPGDARPLAVHQLHRIAPPAVAVDELARRRALGTVRAAIDRRIPAGLLADPHAVRHFGHHGAADRAVRADVLAQRDRSAACGRRAGLGLADAAKLQRAEGGERTGREAGAAQEG